MNEKECKCDKCYQKQPKKELVRVENKAYRCEKCHWKHRIIDNVSLFAIPLIFGIFVIFFRQLYTILH
ncbi:hypothetical protein [endosymbiont GvMRE of Glomus versiforme]|uniref:hypothetical protein n=1 Tax=endosymbiont GvMRE of Glomus versiforme TaxID=2039283 RepID=UPI000EE96A4B|nr:hypothetical protein [endosymbiont GvMRE of Glomus versiforme]RHZ37494.1 hypothetical protein GvMRE_I1g566 [endosymbiont GvMRE of Glomus versiforme]